MKPANSNTETLVGLGPTRIVMRDGRVFEGTPLEIVRDMKFIAFGVDHLDLDSYITWVAANARKFEGVVLETEGLTTEKRAHGLVGAMLRAGLARGTKTQL